MPQLLRKRLILIETESTYATDAAPDGADAVLVRDLNITPQQSDTVSRDLIRPYLGASEILLANTRVECTFSVELAGSGTAGTAPQYGKALQACGLSETIVAATSVTYAPVSASFDSVTIHYNIDGVRHKVTGARGTFVLNTSVGEIPTIDFTFTGIYNAPDDFALPTATYANQATPLIFKNGNTDTFSLLSYSGCLQSVSMDLGNTLVYRELIGCDKEVLITDRASNGTVVIEAPTIAQKDYFTAALTDGTLGNLTFQHGTTAGNIVDFSSTRVDIGDVSYSDQDGIAMLNMPYTAIPSTAGNDEFSLIYT
ncbi:MAG: phage tail tube protein [Halieaceae bacterium]